MNESQQLTETLTALDKQFDLNVGGTPDIQTISFDRLKEILSARLAEMIAHEFDNFVNTLYRIDVNEAKVKGILAEKPLDEAVDAITELIIERQRQKVITREKYAKGNGEIIFDI